MRRAVRWMGLALLVGSPSPAPALTIGPGQGIEVPFSLTAPAAGADTLTFRLANVVAVGVSTMTVELYDGATLLAAVAGVPLTGVAGFVDEGSAWVRNAAPADLTSVRDASAQGRIRVLPDFAATGELDVELSNFTSLLVGNGTDMAQLIPIPGVLEIGEAFAVAEPALALLLAAAASRLLCRAQRPR